MNPETAEFRLDGMQVHPDWNHIETLTIHPDCDTLIIVPGHALFKSSTRVTSPFFDPLQAEHWSLNEYQDAYEVRLIVEHIHTGVETLGQTKHSVLIFSGGCTRIEGEGWTEGASYYAVADYYDWWKAESGLEIHHMKARSYVDVYALDSMDNMWMSIRSFQMMHPRQEVPKRVVVVNYSFKKRLFEHHATVLGIPEFEYIGLEDPQNIVDDIYIDERITRIIASYVADPFAEKLDSAVGLKKVKRNIFNIVYPHGTGRDVVLSYGKQFKRRKATNRSRALKR